MSSTNGSQRYVPGQQHLLHLRTCWKGEFSRPLQTSLNRNWWQSQATCVLTGLPGDSNDSYIGQLQEDEIQYCAAILSVQKWNHIHLKTKNFWQKKNFQTAVVVASEKHKISPNQNKKLNLSLVFFLNQVSEEVCNPKTKWMKIKIS